MLEFLRPGVNRVLTPLGKTLARAGVTPNAITIAGTAGAVIGALWFYPRGEFFAGTMVIWFFVMLDLLDGVVARLTGSSGKWGALLDSVGDRIADAAIFSGLILWTVTAGETVLAGVALFCLAAGQIVSYVKARAEGLGMTANIGLAERGERLIVSLVVIGLDGLGVPYVLAGGLWLLAAASLITVIQRMVVVYRQTS